MKKSIFVILAVLLAVVLTIFTSCESRSGKRAREMKKTEKRSADTLIFSPDKIGVTELLKEFISYPAFDGGTGMKASFFIGIQHAQKTYQIDCSEIRFFRENLTQEKAEQDQSILNLVLVHYLSSNTPKDYLDVTVVNGEVIQIARRAAFFPDGSFYPTKIIWEKK